MERNVEVSEKIENDYMEVDPTKLSQEQIDNAALVIIDILDRYIKNHQ